MVGSLHPTPVATLPFLSPHSAVVAFCEGILKHGTAWEALREELAAKKAAMTLEEVRERMRNVLSLTDVTRFPIPKIPNAVIFVAATVSTIFDYHHEEVLKMDSQHFFSPLFSLFFYQLASKDICNQSCDRSTSKPTPPIQYFDLIILIYSSKSAFHVCNSVKLYIAIKDIDFPTLFFP